MNMKNKDEIHENFMEDYFFDRDNREDTLIKYQKDITKQSMDKAVEIFYNAPSVNEGIKLMFDAIEFDH